MQDPLLHPAPRNDVPGPAQGRIANPALVNPAALVNTVKVGGRTFYWIAGLSVINSLATIFGGGIFFVIGLAATLMVDGIAKGISQQLGGSPIILLMGFLFAFLIDAVFILFGYFAAKGHRWAFIVGMILYGLDALVFLAFKDWIAAGFHAFFLWQLFNGLRAATAFRNLQQQQPATDFGVPPSAAM